MRSLPVIVLAIALPSATHAQAKLPDACTVVTLADVTRAVGPGYAPDPSGQIVTGDDYSACLYSKGQGTFAGVTVLEAPEGDAKAAVTFRQNMARSAGRTVSSLPGVCDTAFAVVLSPSRTLVYAGKGLWQMDVEVITGGRPDAAAEERLAKVACSHLP